MQKKTKIIVIISILLLILIAILTLILTQNKTIKTPQTIEETAKAQYTTQIGEKTFDITNAVTKSPMPSISAGMIPIKWNGEFWQITTKDDKEWYDYSKGQPAYIMLNDGVYQSELIQNMTGKKLAEENIGASIARPEELGSIYMWIPKFAYNDKGEILYIKQEHSVAGTWTMPEVFTYETENIDFSLSGLWVEYNSLANATEVKTKVANMTGKENKYGFIANTVGGRRYRRFKLPNYNSNLYLQPNNKWCRGRHPCRFVNQHNKQKQNYIKNNRYKQSRANKRQSQLQCRRRKNRYRSNI